MRKILTSFAIAFILLLTSSRFTYAVGTEPLKCPVGYFEDSASVLNKYCCENGSAAFPGPKCMFGGVNGAAAKGIENGGVTNAEFCPEGNVWVRAGTDKCYSAGSEVEDGDHKGQNFLGCKSFATRSGTLGGVGVPLTFGFCDQDSAIYGVAKDTCVCIDDAGISHELSGVAKADCQAECTAKGWSISGGVLLRNPEVGCKTAIGGEGVLTALGCIPTESTGLANWAIIFGSIIGGIIAVFKIIQGSFMVMTATGNPDKLQEGKSIITAALIGLVVIVSAVLLLKFFGFDVLGLGSFGFKLD